MNRTIGPALGAARRRASGSASRWTGRIGVLLLVSVQATAIAGPGAPTNSSDEGLLSAGSSSARSTLRNGASDAPGSTVAASSDRFWSDAEPSARTNRTLIPDHYRALSLRRNALAHHLEEALLERSSAALEFDSAALEFDSTPLEFDSAPLEFDPPPLELSLPLPDGTQGRFEVVRSQVMAPELAARYPQIRTYAGRGLDDPTAMVRFDLTQRGFHAMILSARHPTVFIEPDAGPDGAYLCYYRSEIRSAGVPFACESIDADGTTTRIDDLVTQGFGQGEVGEELRVYRTAIAATGEYTRFHGGTVADGLAAVVEGLNRVSGLFERDVAIRMELVPNNDLIIYTDGAIDPYTNDDGPAMLEENQLNLDAVIGSANYDVGHVFSTRGGGIAHIGVACRETLKGRGVSGLSVPDGDVFLTDFVAHEMGHQFGAFHSFNGNAGSCATHRHPTSAYEPGSGSTIMAYAGWCQQQNLQLDNDDYFHARSIELIRAYTTAGSGSECPVVAPTGNSSPTVDAGDGGWVLPIGTPFRLEGSASDPDADPLTYCWEEFDLGPQGPPDAPSGNAPIFRSFNPTESPWRVFPRMSDILSGSHTIGELLPTYARDLRFRLTARDNRILGGGNAWDGIDLTVTDQAGPFRVTGLDTPAIWLGNTVETITWDAARTNQSPVSCQQVDIVLSDDFGATFEHVLVSGVPNDGAHDIVVPNIGVLGSGRLMVRAADHVFFDVNDAFITIQPQTASAPALPATECALSVEPNPSRGSAEIRFRLAHRANAELFIVDAGGRAVATLADGHLDAGEHRYRWSGQIAGKEAPRGVYFVHLSVDGRRYAHRLTKLE
jgi:hypothetical protein